jgi:hypothetical protein
LSRKKAQIDASKIDEDREERGKNLYNFFTYVIANKVVGEELLMRPI